MPTGQQQVANDFGALRQEPHLLDRIVRVGNAAAGTPGLGLEGRARVSLRGGSSSLGIASGEASDQGNAAEDTWKGHGT